MTKKRVVQLIGNLVIKSFEFFFVCLFWLITIRMFHDGNRFASVDKRFHMLVVPNP